MSLSKVHRAEDFPSLQQVHYASFDGSGGIAGAAQPHVAAPNSGAEAQRAEEAFTRGRQAGIKETETKFAATTQALGRALEEISRLRASLLKNSSHEMLTLVMNIARQVIRKEVGSDPDIILATILRALESAVEADSYTVQVHPDDLQIIEEHKPLFLASIQGLDNVHFKADPAIDRGGCLVESAVGQVDATIAGQLEVIEQALQQTLQGAS